MAATATLSSALYSSRHSRVGATVPTASPMGAIICAISIGSAGNISPSSVMVGLSLRAWRGADTGPAMISLRAYFSMAPVSTSLASAWVGTPKPGTSMPMMRTPLMALGKICRGTPLAVGTHRLMMTMASSFSGSACACTASLMSSNSLPVTSDSLLKGT